MCEIFDQAQRIAGGALSRDVCEGCIGNLKECPLYVASSNLQDKEDHQQDEALAHAEGAARVDRFRQKLIGHFQTEAVVENQQRSAH